MKGKKRDSIGEAKKYLRGELSTIEIDLLKRKAMIGSVNTETYYREIGKIYEYKYIKPYLKELIHLYKKHKEEKITEIERKRIKDFLILWNIGLVLKTLEWIFPYQEREGKNMGEYIAEGLQSITSSIEKYQIDFIAEKATKDTKIKLKGVDEDGSLIVELKGNKPFGDIDITVKNIKTKEKESINVPLEWVDLKSGLYKTEVLLDMLEYVYLEEDIPDLRLSVSKKVWHPSTFLTTNCFYALKNYTNKTDPLKISSSSFILSKQIQKITEKYKESFSGEPTERWLAYYLLVQNGEIKRMSKTTYGAYTKKKEGKKLSQKEKNLVEKVSDVLYIMKKEGKTGGYTYLTTNSNKRRALMIKTKEIKEKNKHNYGDFIVGLEWTEDEVVYEKEFEKALDKKEKEIKKMKLSYSGVESLDRALKDWESTSLIDIVWDTSDLDNLLRILDNEFKLKEFKQKIEWVLTPKEKFYLKLYFFEKVPLDRLSEAWFYKSGQTVAGLKKLLKNAVNKLLFYIKYRKNTY